MLQELERRRMFAISVVAGLATINGTASDDVIEVIVSSGKLQVRNGAGTVIEQVNSAGITKVAVNGGGGNDFIRLGRGDGTLMPNVTSTLSGGAGNDTIIGGVKADQIFGGNNNDRLDGRAGADLISGGSGFDTADYSYRTVPIVVTLINSGTGNDGSNSGDNSSPGKYNDNGGDNCADIEAVVGGTAADKLTGTDAADWLDGSGGNDSLYGLGGVDTITGGVANDLGYGGLQDDFFFMKDNSPDQFLGEGGVTSAQFDSGVDSPAPAQAGAALKAKLMQSITNAGGSDNLTLDETFGPDNNGKVTLTVSGINIQINDVISQRVIIPDTETYEDKILAVGYAWYANASVYSSDAVLIRFNADGSLDTSFGEDESGIVYTDFTPNFNVDTFRGPITSAGPTDFGNNDSAESVLIDQLGNIVIAGSSETPNGNFSTSIVVVAKYNSDGYIDSDFASDGIYRHFRLNSDENESVYDTGAQILEQTVFGDDSIANYYVIGGTFNDNTFSEGPTSDDNFGIFRIFQGGDEDGSFGLQIADFGALTEGSSYDQLSGLVIDPQFNAIWASGTIRQGDDADFGVVGFYEWGQQISGSMFTIDFNEGSDDYAEDAVIDDGNLYIVGTSYTYFPETEGSMSEGALALVPLEYPISRPAALVDGAIVNAAPDGIITRIISNDEQQLIFNGVALDNDGHIVVVGQDGTGMHVQQFNTSDLSNFGDSTLVDFHEQGDTYADHAFDAVVQPDGKVVIVGTYDGTFLEMARLERDDTEVWVDIPLTDTDTQNFPFFYIDENGNQQPIPTYLTWRDTAVKPDGTLQIDGSKLGDVVLVNQNSKNIVVTKNGEILEIPIEFVNKIVINTGDGSDLVWVSEYVGVPVLIDTGAGNDVVTGGNKKDTIYAGPGDDRVAGGDGNDYIDLGTGNDIGMGGFGNDLVYGGDGRDMIIGGDGKDTLKGGKGEDALMAGLSKYDYTPEVFEQLRKEWVRTDVSYATRVSHLVNGGGLNGSYKLNKTTLTSSRAVPDVLSGEADRDAFWGNFTPPGDSITDLASNETVTKLN